jgi:hypothetical protein
LFKNRQFQSNFLQSWASIDAKTKFSDLADFALTLIPIGIFLVALAKVAFRRTKFVKSSCSHNQCPSCQCSRSRFKVNCHKHTLFQFYGTTYREISSSRWLECRFQQYAVKWPLNCHSGAKNMIFMLVCCRYVCIYDGLKSMIMVRIQMGSQTLV